MAMKPVAKKILLGLSAAYAVAVVLMLVAYARKGIGPEEKPKVDALQAALQQVSKDLSRGDIERIYAEELAPRGAIVGFNYTLLLQMLNFGLLVALVYAFLWDPLLAFLDKRGGEIAQNLDDAESARETAAAERAEATQDLEAARQERAAARANAAREAQNVRDEIVSKAREESERLIATTREELEAQIAAARAELLRQIGDMACDIAGRVVEREVSSDDHRALVDRFLAELDSSAVTPGPETP